MSAVIVVDNLQKHYPLARPRNLERGLGGWLFPQKGRLQAVDGISLRIEAGERVAVIGPNGAGKSTTLKMLTGILEPSGGDASIHGLQPWRQRKTLARHIGVVFGQRSQLWGELPVRASFALLRHIYEQKAGDFSARLDQFVERFALAPILDQPANRLSLGQRMRCELVASLLHNPSTLFLDEPTIGLDITAKAILRDLIREQAQREGQTVVLTSHDTRDIELVCDRVIVINRGQIIIDQPLATLRKRFLTRKLLTLQSVQQNLQLDTAGLHVRSREPHRLVLEVDTSRVRIEEVIGSALRQGGIEDVTVEDPPMEDIIREIYDGRIAH